MEKIKQLLGPGGSVATNMPEVILRVFNDLFSRQALNSGTLAAGTTTTKLKITSQITALVNGAIAILAASDGATNFVETGTTVLPTYSLTATQVGGFIFTVDNAGGLHARSMGPSNSLSSAPTYPLIPVNEAVVGLAMINTANAATFTSGTTALSATNVQLINVVGPLYPTNFF
jgi:hypothetical protein